MTPAFRATETQEDFSEGMVRDVAPSLIPAAGVYDLVNALLDEDGSPYRRGGTAYKSQVYPDDLSVLDDFNREGESPVDNSKWSGYDSAEATLKLEGEHVAPILFQGSATYAKTVSDGAVYATFPELPAVFGLAIRTAGEGDTATLEGYTLGFGETSSGHYLVSLNREDAGSSTLLAYKDNVKLADGDKFGLMAVGKSLTCWRKPSGGEWELLLMASDATYEEGNLAISMFGGYADDFGGGSITPFSSTGLTWAWDGYLSLGQRTVFADDSNFGVLASDDRSMVNLGGAGLAAPVQSAVLEDLLFIGGSAIYGGSRKEAPYSTGTAKVETGSKVVKGSGTTWNTLVDAGMLFQIGSERVYVVESINSTTELTLRDAYEGAEGSEKSYSLNPVYAIGSDPYEAWEFVTTCANRLVVGFGNTVKVTEINNPHTFVNSLGTVNEHTLPEGAEITGLTNIGETALIFTTAGVWVLDGLALDIVDAAGNPQHRLQQLSSNTVLAGAAGLAGSEQRVVVPAADGIYLMDGISSPTRISRPIDSVYRQRIAAGYKLGRAVVYRSHYFLPILTSGGSVKDLFVCRLDRPTSSRGQTIFPWSRFTGDGGEITAFAVRSAPNPKESVLLGAQAREPSQIEDCSHYFEPDEDHEVDADGTVHDLDVIQRDIQTGNRTINAVRAVKPRYELKGSQSPTLKAFYSDGSAKSNGAKFGHATFGSATFGGGSASQFVPIGEAGESNGHDPARFRINKRLRYVRTRFKSQGPAANCVLREVEWTFRPSEATRR